MMRNQHMIHLAVQENNCDLRLAAWENWLPLYFATNQFSYARYDSYYIEVLANIETLYPGLKQLLQKTELSVQVQEMYPSRVAFDQRREQTVNRDAKLQVKFPETYTFFVTLYIYTFCHFTFSVTKGINKDSYSGIH